MFRAFLPPIVCLALVGCGARDPAQDRTEERGAIENATLAKLELTSQAFAHGQPIPAEFTCDGADRPPSLRWGEPPPGTKSFALVLDDPDAPSATFGHWAAYNIPASTRSIGAGQQVGAQATNDFGKPGYGGPCPPHGHGPHHYRLKLYALDSERLGLPANSRIADVEKAAQQHALARGELVGTYERK